MVALENAERMRTNGIRVTTACLPDSPLAQALNAAGLTALPVRRGHKYLAPGAILTLRRELRARPYRAVLVHQLKDLWQVVPALWGSPARLVGVAHTLVGVKKRDLLHRILYRRVHKLVALTSIHEANLLAHLPLAPSQLTVLPNAVDTKRFRPERRSPEFRARFPGPLIGVVSRLDASKGLVETVAMAERLRAPFSLAIVGAETAGESGMLARLTHEIKARGLENRVFLTGPIRAVEEAIAAFDVLLMPSPGETFGRVLIEAMACGVPIAASRGGGVPDIIEDGVSGLLFDPLDVDGMAAAVTRLLEDPALRARLADNGRRKALDVYDTAVIERGLYRLLEI